jgi:hypothetical protein
MGAQVRPRANEAAEKAREMAEPKCKRPHYGNDRNA